MAYKWKKLSPQECPIQVHESDGLVFCPEDLRTLEQFEIEDSDGDTICRVYSQGEAESLVSHLNR